MKEAARQYRLRHQVAFGRVLRRPWASPRSASSVAARTIVGVEESSGLTKLAFASLWLLVFAMPWEDAITISDFGTSVICGVFIPREL